ncbi:MAG: helix-turn-helix domain-containing protein [Cyclobacteriaceae bacterium]
MKDKKLEIKQYHLHKAHPEKLQFQVHDLKQYRQKSLAKASLPHSHSYYQIIWFFDSGGAHTVDFQTYEIKANTVLFISKDQIHAFDDNLDVEGRLIHFNESFFMHSDVDIFLKYNIFDRQQNPCYEIGEDTIETSECYMSLIQKEFENQHRFGYQDAIRFLLKSFLISLERSHHDDSDKTLKLNSAHELQFFRFKELIEENYSKGLPISEYADQLNVSTKTLTTITKNIADKSPSQLIAERVILEAKRLLKFTTLQVSEITYQLGFEDSSYFIKYFKRYVHSSPRVYRELVST